MTACWLSGSGQAMLLLSSATRFNLRPTEAVDAVRFSTRPLAPIQFQAGLMEDSAAYATTAFANVLPGAGVLKTGKLQEPILFASRPELLLASLSCERMRDHEAIVVRGAARYAAHAGYGTSLRFAAALDPATSAATPVVLMDATDFRPKPPRHQFTAAALRRELGKALVGCAAGNCATLATGNWGCGAFGGCVELKFVLQWVAASVCGAELLYFHFGEAALEPAAEFASALRVADIPTGRVWSETLNWASGRLGQTLEQGESGALDAEPQSPTVRAGTGLIAFLAQTFDLPTGPATLQFASA